MGKQKRRPLREKLKQASWAEIAARGRQEIAKRYDYARYKLRGHFGTTGVDSTPRISAGRFFFSGDDLPSICSELQRRLPERVKEIQSSAERICAHRFDLLGYEGLDYGSPIDWHKDLVHSKRAPLKPWFKIRYLDFDEVGDSKIIWELNRHQHLVILAKACLLTKEVRYAEELFHQWYDWQQRNPYPIGINWASSLEVAFRSLSWIWIHQLLQSTSVMPQAFPNDLAAALALHGRHIEKYLSTYFSPNTHLLGEGVALFFLGMLYPSINNAERWKTKGWEIIQQEAQRQVLSDGMHFERSLHYHVYTLDFLLHARILASVNQISLGTNFDNTIIKMLDALCTLNQAGTLPHFGDDDGGRVFDPERNRVEHLIDPLCTGAVLFDRGDFKATRPLCEETVWLLGKNGLDRFDSLSATSQQTRASLLSSGIYIMADRHAGQQLVIDAGPLGEGRAGHSHADALSLQLSILGREFLSDPGTFSYVNIDRNRLRGTRAHNTLQIDGFDQAEPDGPFGWTALPHVNVEMWQNQQTFDLLVGSQSTQRYPNTVMHQRTVFYLKPRLLFVRDVVTGAGEHQVEQSWHLSPGLNISQLLAANSFLVHESGKGPCLALVMAEKQGSESSIEEDHWSPSYGKLMDSSTIRVTQEGVLPLEFATILAPLPFDAADGGRLIQLSFENNDPHVHGYAYSVGDELHHFVFNDSELEWNTGSWRSNARFFYCALSPRGDAVRWIICGGSFLAMNGRSLIAKGEFAEWSEWPSSSGITASRREGQLTSSLQEASHEGEKILLRTTTEKSKDEER